jgi:signal peptidase I
MKKFIKELIPYIVIVIVVVLIRTFIATPVIVSGDSMVPTLKNKQLLLLNKINYKISDIKRFDVVVINIDNKEIIKRVIGLPGEDILYRSNKLYVDGHEIENDYNFDTDDFSLKTICNCTKIPEDKYLVLGDNRAVSADSRIIGLIDKKDIEGNVNISLWPIKKVK